jgi:hypothetical protein
MSIFVNSKDLLEGEVSYIYVETTNGDERPIPLTSAADKEKHADKLNTIKVFFRKPNYKLFSQIMQDALKTQPDGTIVTQPMAMREAYLKNLLTKWDLKDEDTGELIPVSPQILDNLYPDMAIAILNEYDRLTEADVDFADLDLEENIQFNDQVGLSDNQQIEDISEKEVIESEEIEDKNADEDEDQEDIAFPE